MSKPKKKTPTPRPAPLTWGIAPALLKAKRGFTVERTLRNGVQRKQLLHEERRGWRMRFQYWSDLSNRTRWSPWGPALLGADDLDAKWTALPKRSVKGLK